jgi:large subunit ribosomal protein L25|tara:strand:- start:88 stop:798 length:711 start_codon:yes stop_codon:yes gene_type:complete
MASQYTLEAKTRENFGKRASKRYRKEQLVPAEIYGQPDGNKSVLINSFELTNQIKDSAFYSNVIDLKLGSKKIEVILKSLQRDPQKSQITHIDFLAVSQDKKITVNVPLNFTNEDTCVGVKISGGLISHIITEIEISCLPKNIPESIEVDISELDIGNSIHLAEISLPVGIELLNAGDKEHDTALVKCYAPIEEKIETTAPEAIDPEADSETDAPKDGETAKEEASKDDAADSKKD